MKKFLFGIFFLSVIMSVFAQQYDSEADFTVRLINNDSAVRITRYNGNNTVVRIPPRINNLPVTEIGGFSEKGLTSVIIPDGVTTIRYYAFSDNKLTSVTIPNSVTSIGEEAFSGNQLTSVTIGNRVTTIGNNAFSKNRLASISIPNGITTIGSGAFTENQLASITIPNSVVSIGNFAFAENRLTSAIIQNSSVEIAPNAFWGNYNLTGITVANTTRTLYQWPDLDRYHKIVWEEINEYYGSVRFDDAEINRLYASLGGDLNIADTPLEGALAGYFRRYASQLNDAAESILPHSNPRQVDLQLGVFVYAGLILNRYLNNTAITASHEAMLNFIASRGNATRAEIETHYRNGIVNLISGMVDTELWTVRFAIPIRGGSVTRNGITRAGFYGAELSRKNGVYVLTFRHRSSVILSDASLDALLNKVRNVDDFYYFETNAIDIIRREAAKIPITVPNATISYLKNSLVNFFTTTNQTNFNVLKSINDTFTDETGRNLPTIQLEYDNAIQNVSVYEEMGMERAAESARSLARTCKDILDARRRRLNAPNDAPIDWGGFRSAYSNILYRLNTELARRMR